MRAPSSLSRLSVRQRLTATIALLTTLALVAVGSTLYFVESSRIDRTIESRLTQEINEFQDFRAGHPDTPKPFTSADLLLTSYLQRNLPDPEEMNWSFPISGRPTYVGEPDSALQHSTAFINLVGELKNTGGRRSLDIGGDDYRIVVLPVRQGERAGAFVATHNVSASRAGLRELMVTYGLLAALSLILIAGLASWIAGRLLRPVRRLRDTARGITDGDLGGRLEVTGHDDLSDLQRTFNNMLDRLESVFVTQRQLLDDAGHELRTPLTVLRGHLELVDPTDAADVGATRVLLLDEVDRMSRLVDDLLMLAKAKRPDFVETHPTDVDALTQGIYDRAWALADRRWVFDGTAAGEVDLDEQRITQAALQLADNAVKHTSVGDDIGIGSRLTDGHLELWVRDTGTGIPAAVQDTMFERFQRGERTGDGFGLGLSIVRAIARAHGGNATLDDTESGATVRISIPAGAGG